MLDEVLGAKVVSHVALFFFLGGGGEWEREGLANKHMRVFLSFYSLSLFFFVSF